MYKLLNQNVTFWEIINRRQNTQNRLLNKIIPIEARHLEILYDPPPLLPVMKTSTSAQDMVLDVLGFMKNNQQVLISNGQIYLSKSKPML